jgi:glutamate-1-semialdehyde 2,1-aminomutase
MEFPSAQPKTPTMTAEVSAANCLPGGILTAVTVPGAGHLVIERGQGAHIWDTAGTRYLDLLMGSGAALLGHAHPEIVAAIQAQASRGTTFYALTEPALALAARIVAHYPGAEMLQYCSTGSEATLFALRLARAATGREKVLKFEGGFHGSNDYAMMSAYPTGPAGYPVPEPSSQGIPSGTASSVLVAPYNDAASCERIAAQAGRDLAAILVEPFQRNIDLQPGFLAALRRLADATGACLIFDEVVTGFRLGLSGAAGYCGVVPDIATLGKAIGGGLPIAAIVGSASIMRLSSSEVSVADGFVYCSGTLSGNPLSAAAGLAAMDILERPGTFEHLFSLGQTMRERLLRAFTDHGIPAQALGIGPSFQINPSSEPITDYRSAARSDMRLMTQVASQLVARGVYFTGAKGYLSLAHSPADIDEMASSTTAVLNDVDLSQPRTKGTGSP